ncbi:MAG: hypothetical protein NT178_03755 [Proteobacteria bacterium]|nr:hypothetical protein [Pseudomonadota bacterium]
MYKKSLILLVIILLIASCSTFSKKKEDTSAKTPPAKADKKTEKMEAIEESTQKPGDIKVIDGVEYIYASNRRFMLTPYEPEYVWVRKDQYAPRFGEALTSGGGGATGKKEREETEKRIGKLEEELKKKGIAPQMVYPYQMGSFPAGMGFMPGISLISFNYPSPKMKRRIIVLPMADQTNYKGEGLGDLATRRLVTRLENAGAIICIDPQTVNNKGALTDPENMKSLNELYGIQAILKGTLSDIYTSSSKIEGKDEKDTSFAISKITLEVYNTDTGIVLKQLSGRNPISLTREKGEMSIEKAKIKAIDLAIELLAEDLLKAILTLDWHARVASVETGKVYVNAGRQSGLDKGSILDVYSPGEQIIDSKTKMPLGTIKGKYKGELEVSELFGVDACWAKVKKGSNFSATDLVYFQK